MDFEQARDSVLDTFKAAWDRYAPLYNGGEVPEVEYQNLEPLGSEPHLRRGLLPWARVTVRHTAGEQRSLGVAGGRVFTHHGHVAVQIFVPAGKQGLLLADRLGKVAVDAFEGRETAEGAVWFRAVTYREVGVDDPWFQVNAVAEFEYDIVK